MNVPRSVGVRKFGNKAKIAKGAICTISVVNV